MRLHGDFSHTAVCKSVFIDETKRLKGTERERCCFSHFFLSFHFQTSGVKPWGVSAASKSLSDRRQFYEAVEEDERRRASGGGRVEV